MYEYNKGTTKFILNILSSQILNIVPLIKQLSDAIFISGTSTVITVRNSSKNLYFTLPDETYLTHFGEVIADINIPVTIVYDDINNIFVRNDVDIFVQTGITSVSIQNYTSESTSANNVIILISTNINIISMIIPKLASTKRYIIYLIELIPNFNIVYPNNIDKVTILFPKSTVSSQINSYWNQICSDFKYLISDPPYSSLPILLQYDPNVLIENFLISTKLSDNSVFFSRYLPLYPNIKLEILSPYKKFSKCKQIIWLINKTKKNNYKIRNIEFNYKNVHIAIFTNNFKKYVQKYYCLGYRKFVLDAPTIYLLKIPIYQDCVYICPITTDVKFRKNKENFVYCLCNDQIIVSDLIYQMSLLTKQCVVLSNSDNTRISDYQSYLEQNNIVYVKYSNLVKIPVNTTFIGILGTNQQCDEIINYIINSKLSINFCRRFNNYFTSDQENKLKLYNISYDSIINGTTFQPFLDSKYTQSVIPQRLVQQQLYNYLNISNVIFKFNVNFLYRFGYYVSN